MNLAKSVQTQTSIWSLSQTQNFFPNLLLGSTQIKQFLERKLLDFLRCPETQPVPGKELWISYHYLKWFFSGDKTDQKLKKINR